MFLLASTGGGDVHLILLVIFIVVMMIWLVGGAWTTRSPDGNWNLGGIGGTILPWIAVAILGYLVFA